MKNKCGWDVYCGVCDWCVEICAQCQSLKCDCLCPQVSELLECGCPVGSTDAQAAACVASNAGDPIALEVSKQSHMGDLVTNEAQALLDKSDTVQCQSCEGIAGECDCVLTEFSKCYSCLFWHTHGDRWDGLRWGNKSTYGDCRKRAPYVKGIVLDSGEHNAQWPTTKNDDGCGAHKPSRIR